MVEILKINFNPSITDFDYPCGLVIGPINQVQGFGAVDGLQCFLFRKVFSLADPLKNVLINSEMIFCNTPQDADWCQFVD